MIKTISKVLLNDNNTLIQYQFINENFIVTELNGKKLIYISGSNLFSVNTENKTLKAIEISQQVEQINKVKTMLGELKEEGVDEIKEIAGYNSIGKKIYSSENSTIKLLMNVYIANIPGLENTVYPEFSKFEQSKQLAHLSLQPNEIIASMSSEIFMQGNLAQRQSMEIVSIESELEDNNEFYEYLTYSHEQ